MSSSVFKTFLFLLLELIITPTVMFCLNILMSTSSKINPLDQIV